MLHESNDQDLSTPQIDLRTYSLLRYIIYLLVYGVVPDKKRKKLSKRPHGTHTLSIANTITNS